jgi:hypothetical protein
MDAFVIIIKNIFNWLGIWRNGRRYGLKIRCPQGRKGSSPFIPIFIG